MEGRRGTTDEFATTVFHLVLFSAALVELAKSIPVHSLICIHTSFSVCLFFFFLSLCPVGLSLPEDLETWSNNLSFQGHEFIIFSNGCLVNGFFCEPPHWEHLKPKPDCSHPTFYRECLEALSDCMLEQMVTSPTRGQNILDLFFITNPTLVDDISVIPGLSDHDIVLAQVNIKPEVTKAGPS